MTDHMHVSPASAPRFRSWTALAADRQNGSPTTSSGDERLGYGALWVRRLARCEDLPLICRFRPGQTDKLALQPAIVKYGRGGKGARSPTRTTASKRPPTRERFLSALALVTRAHSDIPKSLPMRSSNNRRRASI